VAGRVARVGISLLLALVLSVAGVLLLWSPGKPGPVTDENGTPLPGSISEKIRVQINGVSQGMFIKGSSASNPVLLYLHGGMPEYFLTRHYPTGFERQFTVVWWDRRGLGLSYSADTPPATITLDQLIADTIEVTNYLRHRFGQEKIYLMAHSGGTFIGIQAVARAPELYHAYIGVAQMSNQLGSEKLAYDYMLQRFAQLRDRDMVRRLEAAPVTLANGTPAAYLRVRDEAMHRLGIGTTHDMTSVVTGLFLESWRFPEYTVAEKFNLWRGKVASGVSYLWDEALATDLSTAVPALDVPVYFLHGAFDYTCAYTEARAYFERLQAPVKGFYTFARSAHSPMFEEPEKTLKILRADVLVSARSLADPAQ
jgi:pimeloyl-ACP methyl ester carboxylesterase